MKVKIPNKAILLLIVSVTFLSAAAGCGNAGKITPLTVVGARELIKQDRSDLENYIGKMNNILLKVPTVQERAKKMSAVAALYRVFWPGALDTDQDAVKELRSASGSGKQPQTKIYGSLYGLSQKRYVLSDGHVLSAHSIPAYVAAAASKYAVAADSLDSLVYFEQELAQYATGDGTRVKPGSPPPREGVSEFGKFGGLYVELGQNEGTGEILVYKYKMDPQYDSSRDQVPVHDMERFFVEQARTYIKEGDDALSKKG